MSFEHPQPRFGGRVPVAQRLRRARRHRSRQGRRAGSGRPGLGSRRGIGQARAGRLPKRLQSHPTRGGGQVLKDLCKLGRVQPTVCAQPAGAGAAPPCPAFLGNGGATIPDWGGQRLGTLRETFSRHPKIAFFAIGIHKTCLLKIRTKLSQGNFAVDTG